MASSYRQRRRRAIIFGIVAGLAILTVLMFPEYAPYLGATPSGNFSTLDWNVLMKGALTPNKKGMIIPNMILAQNHKLVTVKGYLLPLHQGTEASEFYLAPKPRGCYFCYPPGISEVIKFEMAGGKTIRQTDLPVRVFGTFSAGEANQGVMYKIDDAKVRL